MAKVVLRCVTADLLNECEGRELGHSVLSRNGALNKNGPILMACSDRQELQEETGMKTSSICACADMV